MGEIPKKENYEDEDRWSEDVIDYFVGKVVVPKEEFETYMKVQYPDTIDRAGRITAEEEFEIEGRPYCARARVVVLMTLRHAVIAQQLIPSLLVGAVDADPGGNNLFSPPLAHLAVPVPWFVLGDDARIIACFIQLHDSLQGDDVLDVFAEVIDILHFVSLREA